MKTYTETVSPQKAAAYLSHNYEKNRRISRDKVKFYASEMQKSRFAKTAMIHFVYLNGQKVLINGQHTLSAVIEAKKNVELVIAEDYVKSETELAHLFSRMDVGAKRRAYDSLAPFGYDEKYNLSKTNLNNVLSAVLFIKHDFKNPGRKPNHSIQDQMGMLEEWLPTAELAYDVILGIDKTMLRKIRNRASLSVVLATMRYQEKKAVEFWGKVMSGVGFHNGDPRQVLRDKLLQMTMQGGGTTASNQYSVEYISRACAVAWNSFYDGSERRVIIIRDQNAPIVIKGTPYI